MKQKSLPKLFRKPISEKKLQRKVLRRIHIEKEKQFLLSKLQRDDQGRYYLPGAAGVPDGETPGLAGDTAGAGGGDTGGRELTKEDLKRLKAIAKAVRKNKGLLTAWKAGLVGVIVVAVIGFNLFFKNRLLERAAEQGLQRIFNAAVEIEGTDFSLIRGTIGFESFAAADEDRPMRNLIELGRTRLDLDVGRALSRKIIFDEITCREIRFDTPRTVSGALPGSGSDTAKDGGQSGGDVLGELAGEAGALGLEIGRESAERLIEKHEKGLKTLPLIDSVQARYTEMSTRWGRRTGETEDLVESFEARTADLLATDITTIDTPGEVESYLTELNTLKSEVEEARETVEEVYRDFTGDLEYVRTSSAEIAAAVEADIAYLAEALGTIGADAAGMIASVAEPVIRERLGRYYRAAEKALRIYTRLAGDEKEAGRRGRIRLTDRGRRGTRVSFPTVGYPAFLIKHFEVSAGADGESGFSEFILRDLTGDHETWGRPTTAGFTTSSLFGAGGTELMCGIIVDSRGTAEYLLDSTAAVRGIPLAVSGGLEPISISSFGAASDTTFGLDIAPDMSGRGSLGMELSGLDIVFSDTAPVIRDVLVGLLDDIETLTLNASFAFAEGSITDLTISTDIDRILQERIGSYLREQAERAAAEVEAAFRSYIEDELETNEALRGEIAEKGGEILSDVRSIEDLERLIEKEKQALRDRARREVEKGTGELEDKAREQLEGLGNQLNLPSF